MQRARFQPRCRQPVLDAANSVPKVQQARGRLPVLQKAEQPAAEPGGFGQVGFALFGPQQENGGRIGHVFESGIEQGEVFGDFNRRHGVGSNEL